MANWDIDFDETMEVGRYKNARNRKNRKKVLGAVLICIAACACVVIAIMAVVFWNTGENKDDIEVNSGDTEILYTQAELEERAAQLAEEKT